MTDAERDSREGDFFNPTDTHSTTNPANDAKANAGRQGSSPRSPSRKKPRKLDDANSPETFLESAASRAGEYQPPSACRRATSYSSLAPRTGDGFMPDALRQGMPSSGPGTDRTSTSGSRSSNKQEEEPEPTAEAFARMSRSERKRYREKKRRNEVNKGFDDLMALLLKVDPTTQVALEDIKKGGPTRRQAGKNLAAEADNPIMNRVDLISRAVVTLERMSRENVEQKALLEQIGRGGDDVAAARQAIKDDRVLLMIPFLSPTGPVMARQPADSSTFQSQQHPPGLHQATAMASGARNQNNMPFSPMAYQQAAQQPAAASIPSRYRDPQGYPPGEEGGFNQAYFARSNRPMQDGNSGSGSARDRQNTLGQRGPMP